MNRKRSPHDKKNIWFIKKEKLPINTIKLPYMPDELIIKLLLHIITLPRPIKYAKNYENPDQCWGYERGKDFNAAARTCKTWSKAARYIVNNIIKNCVPVYGNINISVYLGRNIGVPGCRMRIYIRKFKKVKKKYRAIQK